MVHKPYPEVLTLKEFSARHGWHLCTLPVSVAEDAVAWARANVGRFVGPLGGGPYPVDLGGFAVPEHAWTCARSPVGTVGFAFVERSDYEGFVEHWRAELVDENDGPGSAFRP